MAEPLSKAERDNPRWAMRKIGLSEAAYCTWIERYEATIVARENDIAELEDTIIELGDDLMHSNSPIKMRIDRAALKKDNKQLYDDLLKYGNHIGDCPQRGKLMPDRCTCGLREAIAVG